MSAAKEEPDSNMVKNETAETKVVDDSERSRPKSRSRSPAPSAIPRRSRSPERARKSRSRSRSRSPVRRARSRSRSPRRRSSRSRSRSRDRDRRRDRTSRDEPKWAGVSSHRESRFDPARKAMNREVAAVEAAKRSKKECRVYVGNLSFAVKWNDLKDFMREAGNVVFAEIMMLPNGMSKGCGVVEYSSPDEAQRAIRELNDQTLLGRPLFIREDREEDARYGSAAVSGRAGYMGPGAFAGGGRGGFSGGRGGYAGGAAATGMYGGGGAGFGAQPSTGSGRHLFVQGLPFNVGWQDLKDLFRAAGSIIRADVKIGADGNSTGMGTVVFETVPDAQNAIAMYNGFEFQGNILEVREDRFPGGGGRGGYGGGFGGRGGFGGGRGGFAGGAYGGFGAGAGYGVGAYGTAAAGLDGFGGAFVGNGGVGAPAFAPRGPSAFANIPPSTQIFVKNLPWATSNEDLVELFQTTGTVENAEVLVENGRSKGSGIVEFASIEEAEGAIAKFQGYSYGGRPLALEFNARPHTFVSGAGMPAAVGGGDASRMDEDS